MGAAEDVSAAVNTAPANGHPERAAPRPFPSNMGDQPEAPWIDLPR